MPGIPFVVGQWVRGDRFYGRAAQIGEILKGPRNSIWLLGTRRIGKTSLLKQIEHLVEASPEHRFFPVFWDFQGAEEPRELHLNFADALLDADERLERIGIEMAEIAADDLFVSMGKLRRLLRAKSLRLLLLCDEVEELINLQRADPSLLRKLRRVLQNHEDVRSVLASTIRLWDLAGESVDTSPFLHGFTPPLYLERLADEEARALIDQVHLDPAERPSFPPGAIETIREQCGNHPSLIQIVAKRCLETGDVDQAIEQVATDRMVSHFFSVDFEMLSEEEQQVLRALSQQAAATPRDLEERLGLGPEPVASALHRLECLGFVARGVERRCAVSNQFFHRWLREMPERSGAKDGASSPPAPWGPDEETAPPEAALGVIDDRYELLEVAGEGATGIVYQAYDRQLRTKVAIKILRREITEAADAVERFRQEVVLARDISHPNILRIYHLGTFEGRFYLTMQWVDGPNLAEIIRRDAPLPIQTVLTLGRKLASALEAAHRRQTLHRDIKPQNVLLDRAGEPLVTDFGLARPLSGPSITRSGMFLGTPSYSSPEQAELRSVDERSDIYALGLVLFEMVTGRRPFESESLSETLRMHRETPPPDPREIVPTVPGELAELILRCLRKAPAERYPSAAALREDLEAIEKR